MGYCRAPSTKQYKVGSRKRSAPNLDNLLLETTGKEMNELFPHVLCDESQMHLL